MAQANKLFAVRPAQGKVGYVDGSGHLQIAPRFDSGGDFTDGIAPVTLHGHAALIDSRGAIIAEPSYQGRRPDRILPFQEGVAHIAFDVKSPKMGAVDRTGAVVIPPDYDQIGDFVDGIAAARMAHNAYVFLDRKGSRLFGRTFEHATDFSEGLAAVQIGEKNGYIDARGKPAIPPAFDETGPFVDGLAPVRGSGDYRYIDSTGHVAIKGPFESAHPFSQGLAAVRRGDSFGFIDREGRQVIAPTWGFAYGFEDGHCTVHTEDLQGSIDLQGRLVIPVEYDEIGGWGDGLCAVRRDGRWGYLDAEGRPALEMMYESAGPFRGGWARVTIKGARTWIDLKGRPIWMLSGKEQAALEAAERTRRDGGGLSAAVVRQALKLGAKSLKQPSLRTTWEDPERFPAPLRAFFFRLEWPKGKTFKGRPKHGRHGVLKKIDWTLQPPEFLKALPGAEGRQLVLIGVAEGGNELLCVDVNDPHPEDPTVYVADHEDRFDGDSCQAGLLSEFLSCLSR